MSHLEIKNLLCVTCPDARSPSEAWEYLLYGSSARNVHLSNHQLFMGCSWTTEQRCPRSIHFEHFNPLVSKINVLHCLLKICYDCCWVYLDSCKSFVHSSQSNYSESTKNKHASINMETFPSHMRLEISVKAQNRLGNVESDHLIKDAEWFGEFCVFPNLHSKHERCDAQCGAISFHSPQSCNFLDTFHRVSYKHPRSATPCCRASDMHWVYFQSLPLPVHVSPVDKMAPNSIW